MQHKTAAQNSNKKTATVPLMQRQVTAYNKKSDIKEQSRQGSANTSTARMIQYPT